MESTIIDLKSSTVEEIEKATQVARRLLGFKEEGAYAVIFAAEDLWPCEIVTVDNDAHARRWSGTGEVMGLTVGPIKKGCSAWIQLKS